MKKTIKLPTLESLKNAKDGSKLFIYEKYYYEIKESHCFTKRNDKWNEYMGHRFTNDNMRWYLETLRDVAPYLYKVELKKN